MKTKLCRCSPSSPKQIAATAFCWCSPTSPKQIAATVFCFATGVVLFAVGAHLSYVNIEPQRARTLARDKFVMEHLRKKYGYEMKFEYEK